MPGSKEIILEHVQIGNSVRVTAVDVDTGTEVVFQAPRYATEADIRRTAINKINYVLRKQKE